MDVNSWTLFFLVVGSVMGLGSMVCLVYLCLLKPILKPENGPCDLEYTFVTIDGYTIISTDHIGPNARRQNALPAAPTTVDSTAVSLQRPDAFSSGDHVPVHAGALENEGR